jgi:hypothetical protein
MKRPWPFRRAVADPPEGNGVPGERIEATMPVPGQLGMLDEQTTATSRPARQRLLAAIVAGAVLLAAAGAAAGYVAWTNKQRADDWQAQASELQRKASDLENVLVIRTRALNVRTEDLNALAEKVADAERAIERSEADVKHLEHRQRQLAAEKADVEDARAQLALQTTAIEDVASAFIDCKDGLTQLLSYVLNEDYYGATGIAPRVDSDCAGAESALSSYQASYP